MGKQVFHGLPWGKGPFEHFEAEGFRHQLVRMSKKNLSTEWEVTLRTPHFQVRTKENTPNTLAIPDYKDPQTRKNVNSRERQQQVYD